MLDCRLNEDMVLAEDCIPGVLENLKKEGYELGIITNAFPSRRYFDLKVASLDKYFDPIIITSEEGLGKKEKRLYEIALEKVGISPEESMFVDNKLSYLRTAQKAGINYLVLIDREENHRKENLGSMEVVKSIRNID